MRRVWVVTANGSPYAAFTTPDLARSYASAMFRRGLGASQSRLSGVHYAVMEVQLHSQELRVAPVARHDA